MIKSLFNKARVAIVAAALAVTGAFAGGAPAQAQVGELPQMRGWVVLGVADIGGRWDRDRVPGTRADRFSEVRFCFIGGRVRVRDASVTFGNGRTRELDVKRRFRSRECTRAIDLPGRRSRFIDTINFEYRARAGNPAVIVLAR